MTTWCDTGLMYCSHKFRLCLSEEDFHKTMKRMGVKQADWPAFVRNDHSDATAHLFYGTEEYDRCAIVCLRLRDGVTGVQVASLLVHEAVHIWQEHRESIGEKNPGSEQEAYAIQSIAQNLMHAYVEQTT